MPAKSVARAPKSITRLTGPFGAPAASEAQAEAALRPAGGNLIHIVAERAAELKLGRALRTGAEGFPLKWLKSSRLHFLRPVLICLFAGAHHNFECHLSGRGGGAEEQDRERERGDTVG